jgi:hypothetical protein
LWAITRLAHGPSLERLTFTTIGFEAPISRAFENVAFIVLLEF